MSAHSRRTRRSSARSRKASSSTIFSSRGTTHRTSILRGAAAVDAAVCSIPRSFWRCSTISRSFPTIKDSYLRIQSLIRDNASLKAIADEIEKDCFHLDEAAAGRQFGLLRGEDGLRASGGQGAWPAEPITSLILTTSVMGAVTVLSISRRMSMSCSGITLCSANRILSYHL